MWSELSIIYDFIICAVPIFVCMCIKAIYFVYFVTENSFFNVFIWKISVNISRESFTTDDDWFWKILFRIRMKICCITKEKHFSVTKHFAYLKSPSYHSFLNFFTLILSFINILFICYHVVYRFEEELMFNKYIP